MLRALAWRIRSLGGPIGIMTCNSLGFHKTDQYWTKTTYILMRNPSKHWTVLIYFVTNNCTCLCLRSVIFCRGALSASQVKSYVKTVVTDSYTFTTQSEVLFVNYSSLTWLLTFVTGSWPQILYFYTFRHNLLYDIVLNMETKSYHDTHSQLWVPINAFNEDAELLSNPMLT